MAVMFAFNAPAGQANCWAMSSILGVASLTGPNDVEYDSAILVDA
jgi:hypothetical protein